MNYFSKSDRRNGKDRRKGETVTPEILDRRSGKDRRSGTDRRDKARLTLNTYCPVTMQFKNNSINALMTNLNDLGAMFRLFKQDDSFIMVEGEKYEFEVQTPYGKTSFQGRIVWSNIIDGFKCWGIEFTRLSKDEKDPLMSFIDSPF
jgi:hypothetical protein